MPKLNFNRLDETLYSDHQKKTPAFGEIITSDKELVHSKMYNFQTPKNEIIRKHSPSMYFKDVNENGFSATKSSYWAVQEGGVRDPIDRMKMQYRTYGKPKDLHSLKEPGTHAYSVELKQLK